MAAAHHPAALPELLPIMIEWPRMRNLLAPKRGERFAIVSDVVTGDTLLVDTERLYVVMSDSKYEQELNSEIIERARGDVLSLGYGLGFIVQLLQVNPAVTSITILEKEQEVLDLVGSQLTLAPHVRVILADALEWIPDGKFDVIYDDCDYTPEDLERVMRAGINIDVEARLKPYLKENGQFIHWSSPAVYYV